MKIFQFLSAILLVLVVSSCVKRHTLAVIDRNCTGTYLNVHDRVYRVCNEEKLAAFQNSEVVDVHFRITHECDNLDDVICMMAVDFDEVVEILSVN